MFTVTDLVLEYEFRIREIFELIVRTQATGKFGLQSVALR